jgi:hypothetical protein
MRMMGIVDLQIVGQAGVKIVGRSVIAALEKTPRQDAQPQRHLMQPRAMYGCKVKAMLMRRIAEEGTPLHTALQLLFQDTPDAGATQGLQSLLRQRGDQVVQPPSGGGTMIRGRFPGRHRQHLDALRGGKRAAGDPSAGHPAGR